jgi:RNA polymerase sigma factor (sigma-70 family)
LSQRRTGTHDPLVPAAFRDGEERAFDCLFREYFVPLTWFANRILHDEKNAEDIVQDAFVILWQRRKKHGHVTAISAYLYATVRNQCLKQLRKAGKKPSGYPGAVTEASIEEAMIAAETAVPGHRYAFPGLATGRPPLLPRWEISDRDCRYPGYPGRYGHPAAPEGPDGT